MDYINKALDLSSKTKDSNEKNLDYNRQIKTASTEIFNDGRVESNSQSGRRLLNILMETEQDMRKQRRKKRNQDKNRRSSFTMGDLILLSDQSHPNYAPERSI
ncbi:hypothetical protein N7495_001062 [Penicillium taxi]|uniref:uncharacterized protein n=1 Tax=Penicillium taxi TaxID=168475 RepID=UPI0025450B9A|nr:uncharacterized protein N7495_001062 [Penicillium taxi]KAJ5908380.1 hypothetical protein N7495_001062 [Penicillium taxi]